MVTAKKAIFGGGGGAVAGEAINYNRSVSNDKVADAKAAPGGVLTLTQTATVGPFPAPPFAHSTATQTVTVGGNGNAGVIGLATAEVNRGNPPPPHMGFAAGIVNDPLTVTGSGTVAFDLSTLLLEATQPGDFADAFIELGSSVTGDLLSLDVHIDSSTTSLSNVQFTFDIYNPLLGFATSDAFLANVLDPNLTFNPLTHQLTANSVFALFNLPISPSEGDVDLTFNYGSFAGGTSTPEPRSLGLLSIGFAGLALGLYLANALAKRR